MLSDREFSPTDTTTCGYCGVGCRLETHVYRGRVMSISPALDGPANEGHTCVKGRFAHQFSRSRDRLTAPLIREGDGFRLATWDEALEPHCDRVQPHQVRARPRCNRRPGLLARDQRGLLPDAAHDARSRSAPTTSTTARASAIRRRRSLFASRSVSPAPPAHLPTSTSPK